MSNDELQKAIDDITNEGMAGVAPQENTGAAVELPEEMISGNKNPMPVVGDISPAPADALRAASEGTNIEVQAVEPVAPATPDLSNNPFASSTPVNADIPTNVGETEGLPTLDALTEAPAPAPETMTDGGVEVPVNIPVEVSEEAPAEAILPEAPAVPTEEIEAPVSVSEPEETPAEEVNAPASASEAPETAETPEVGMTAVPENETSPEAPESLSGIGETGDIDIEQIKTEAMNELYPLLDVMNGYPEKKFEVALSIAKKGDKKAFQTALEAAKAISDSTVRGESLMKLIEAIEEM